MKNVMAIRHVHFEDAGIFASALKQSGYSLQYCDAGADDLDNSLLPTCDLLLVLGAPIGVYEEDKYPFLCREIEILEKRLHSGKPTIGICLGAQLMARALGARVYPGPAKEIGWAPVELTAAGKRSAARHLEGGPVLHWHGDTFDLPPDAERLASTSLCRNQAFRLGKHAIGFQFHPEASGENFERWLIGHAVEIASVSGLSVADLRRDTRQYARESAERGKRCLIEWLETASLP